MSMDLTFLSDSYMQQILHQLKNVRDQEMQKKGGFRFEDILSSKEDASGVVSSKNNIPGTVSAEAKEYAEYLKKTYGNVMIRSVGKDQQSMDDLGMGTAGTGNVVIAPNILEQMVQDPEKAAYYEGKIKRYFQELPKIKAEISAMGHEIHSCGIVIHPDGTETYYITGDLKPEVRARIEAQIRAEQEEKASRRRMYFIQSKEAAERRTKELQNYMKHKMMTDQIRLDLTGERGVLTDRGTDWISALAYMGGHIL